MMFEPFDTVYVDFDQVDLCRDYALTVDVRRPGDLRSIDRRRYDHLKGKIGEFVFHNWARKRGLDVSEPDCMVRSSRSYDPDLFIGRREIEVKATEIDGQYNDAWSITVNAVAKMPDSRVLGLVRVGMSDASGEVVAAVRLRTLIRHGLLQPPRRREFEGRILGIYMDDVLELPKRERFCL